MTKIKLGYHKFLYKVEQEDFCFIHRSRGLYVITDLYNLYVGKAHIRTLYQRIQESHKERHMNNCHAYYFPEELFFKVEGITIQNLIDELEICCIQSFFTLKECNAAPFSLINVHNRNLLPKLAWNKECANFYTLPLAITDTVLYDIGMPSLFRRLSCYQLQSQFLCEEIIAAAGGLDEIMKAEVEMRLSGSSEPELNIIHPA